MTADPASDPGPVARLRAFFERAFLSQMTVAPSRTGYVVPRHRGHGRPGNGGHPTLTSLHAGIARAEARRQEREAAGRWAP